MIPALPPRLLQHQIPAVDSGHEVLVPSEMERTAEEQAVECCMTKHFFCCLGGGHVGAEDETKAAPRRRFWGSKHQEFLACGESHEEKQRRRKKERSRRRHTHTHMHFPRCCRKHVSSVIPTPKTCLQSLESALTVSSDLRQLRSKNTTA